MHFTIIMILVFVSGLLSVPPTDVQLCAESTLSHLSKICPRNRIREFWFCPCPRTKWKDNPMAHSPWFRFRLPRFYQILSLDCSEVAWIFSWRLVQTVRYKHTNMHTRPQQYPLSLFLWLTEESGQCNKSYISSSQISPLRWYPIWTHLTLKRFLFSCFVRLLWNSAGSHHWLAGIFIHRREIFQRQR